MQVFWDDDDKTILIRQSPENWVWNDYLLCVLRTRQMAQEVKHPVYLILDCRGVKVIPQDSMSYFNVGHQALPLNIVMRVLVTRNKLLQTIFALLRQIVPHNFENFYAVSTMEEAYKKIAEAKTNNAWC
jgi:hypothetical protein